MTIHQKFAVSAAIDIRYMQV